MQASSGFRGVILGLKVIMVLSTLISATLIVSGSVNSDTGTRENIHEAYGAPEPGAGNELFAAKCARCHGADGKGDTVTGRSLDAPDFTDESWKGRHSTAEMTSVVVKGQKGMPAFGTKLTRRQISSLVAYVRSFK